MLGKNVGSLRLSLLFLSLSPPSYSGQPVSLNYLHFVLAVHLHHRIPAGHPGREGLANKVALSNQRGDFQSEKDRRVLSLACGIIQLRLHVGDPGTPTREEDRAWSPLTLTRSACVTHFYP